jgi:glycerol-3-phosphate acyltransferase PlsX
MTRIYQKYDYNEYGGAPLLGVNGTGVICHGSSNAKTIRNTILKIKQYHQSKINDKIIEYLSKSSIRTTDEQGS